MLFAYTSLIDASAFDGIVADVQTSAGGLISVALVVVGVGFLIRVFIK